MTNFEPWRPPADPNARTQALGSASAPEQDPCERTKIWAAERSATDIGAVRARGMVNRRRVLFAAGGLMLLAGGGVATATAAESRARQAARTTGAANSRPLTGSVSAKASHSASASAPASASVPASASGSGATSAPATATEPSTTSASSSASPQHSSIYTQPQWYVDDEGPMAIALTMDDGPDPTYTPQVLEILRRYDIKATFNMVGQHIGPNLSLVREVSAAGHTITNHTWDHADLTHYSYKQVLSQMDRCNDALSNANQHPTIFRAPYGNWSKAVFQACAARNLRPVGWSVDPRDWDTSEVDSQQIVQNVLRNTRAHDIILEHDGGGDRRNTVAALKVFIPALIDKGYHFVAM